MWENIFIPQKYENVYLPERNEKCQLQTLHIFGELA